MNYQSKKSVFIFGNPDFECDAAAPRMLPELKRRFPDMEFAIKDPNEELDVPEDLIIIDTVFGIERVEAFFDLSHFMGHPNVSLHDFDLYSSLKYLKKLGKLKNIKIIGVPPALPLGKALDEAGAMLRSIQP